MNPKKAKRGEAKRISGTQGRKEVRIVNLSEVYGASDALRGNTKFKMDGRIQVIPLPVTLYQETGVPYIVDDVYITKVEPPESAYVVMYGASSSVYNYDCGLRDYDQLTPAEKDALVKLLEPAQVEA
jgi:hypothetical protein